MQSWYHPHPYGVYPRGNATSHEDIFARLGTLSVITTAATADDKEHTELPYIELVQHLLSFLDVPGLCRLSRSCTGWYVLVHCTDAFKAAYTALSPKYLHFRDSWKETAVRHYMRTHPSPVTSSTSSTTDEGRTPASKRARRGTATAAKTMTMTTTQAVKRPPISPEDYHHRPVRVGRAFFCDHLFQAWMCTILPTHYHLEPIGRPAAASRNDDTTASSSSPLTAASSKKKAAGVRRGRAGEEATATPPPAGAKAVQQFRSAFRPVDRRSGLSADDFRREYEHPNLPVILTNVATEWPVFKILNESFTNLTKKKELLVRDGSVVDAPMRCEYTNMSLDDYVHYATEQQDERPIYLFDAEFGSVLDVERLYTVPEHFARDD